MIQLALDHTSKQCHSDLSITGSKSETNRLLLLQALFPQISIENKSNSDDSVAMAKAISSDDALKDIHHAGTAMRFLTAYFSALDKSDIVLTGSQRMQERPIALLVDALNSIGAKISYLKNDGFPPLKIQGVTLEGGKVALPANISSQYISALLLVAPKFKKGLELHLEGEITSLPYIKMTLALLNRIGVSSTFEGSVISIPYQDEIQPQTQIVESDWSSASYWFSVVALSDAARISLTNYRADSLQGDAVLMEIYEQLGVDSSLSEGALILEKKKDFVLPKHISLHLVEAPDIAQTIAVSCYGLGVGCTLTGLHTLKIKETDRLVALQNELTKVGAELTIDDKSLELKAGQNFKPHQSIATYNDHRMAMAFAPLALRCPLLIKDAGVVSKSYPSFWEDMQKVGFQLIEK